jgi:hypothetical protein
MKEEVLFKGSAYHINGFLGIYTKRGHLLLTSKFLRFFPSLKGKAEEFSIDEIVGVEKFGFNGIGVYLHDGRIERFRLWSRGTFIERLKNVKGNLSVTSMKINPLGGVLGIIGIMLWLASLFTSWMVALPTPFIEVPISPAEQLYISFTVWGVLGFLGSNFFFICVIIVILFGLFIFALRDFYGTALSGMAGIVESLIILILIQSQSFSIERPAPFGSIEFLRFRPDIGLFIYLVASITIFAAGYAGISTSTYPPPHTNKA